MGFEVRAARRDDADAITDVQVTAWRTGYAHVLPESLLYADDFDAVRRDFWRSWRFAPGYRVAVAVDDSVDPPHIVGFSSFGPERERARGFTGRGEISAIYVHPDAWGRGAASALMTHTELRLRSEGFESAVLWVLDDNARARTFYEKFGWSPSGLTADFHGDDDVRVPEVEYRKELA
jgi:ribosomal protein S18 acetylase RimI-like enzyme